MANPTGEDDHYAHLIEAVEAAGEPEKAASLVARIVQPEAGVLDQLADLLETAADHVRETTDDTALDLHYDFTDAATALRGIAGDLTGPAEHLRALVHRIPHAAPPDFPAAPPPSQTASPTAARRTPR
ncbi:hypothetical protein ACL02R_11570 [Streptomyces sp. MS19]|uniref:hypothetical protein n=1 Tax=Streptomyces sp. MS19 TaxID=3385972 RepID=UPI0039A1E1AC